MRKITTRLVFFVALIVALTGVVAAGVIQGQHTPQVLAAGAHIRAAVANTATFTPTATATSTATASATPTRTATATTSPTATATATVPVTATATTTATSTPLPGGPTSDYFAEGYTGLAATNGTATFTEVLNILNPSPTNAATVKITYYIQGVTTPVTVTHTINAKTSLRESVNTDVGNDKIVAAVVASNQRVYATRTITRISPTGQRLDGSTTLPVTAPSTSWGFAEGYTGVTFQEYLTVLNPTGTQANVHILLAPQAATDTGARTLNFTVPALSRVTENIRSLNQGNSAQSVGMVITSDQPIVPERVLYFGNGAGSGKFGSTVARGTNAPSTSMSFAYGTSGGATPTSSGLNSDGNQAFITLLNPSLTVSSTVGVSFFNVAGQQLGSTVTKTLAPGTRQTVIANTTLGTASVNMFSVRLNATSPIMAESAQYYGGSPNIGNHPGVDFPGQTTPTSIALLTDLSTKSADGEGVNRDLYLYNPGAAAITVSATYYGTSGNTATASYTVPAGGIIDVDVNGDTQTSIPLGAVGAELSTSSGSFIAYGVGITNDGLSATEDIGTAAY
jgi:hypothetical protein